jgi:PPP family 3-phenylpropionic acid transporter
MSSLPPLSPDQIAKPPHFELRISVIFAAIFLSLGIHLPYFPLWLEARGFDAAQIALILSAPIFLRVLTTPLITAMADESRDRAHVLILMAAAALLIACGYFLNPTYLIVLSVSLLLTVPWSALSPLTDSLALSGVRRYGSSYARMRIWGSASFLVANFAGGIALSFTGPGAVPAMIAGLLALALVATLWAPKLGRPRRASPLSAADLQQAGPRLFNRRFVSTVVGAGLIVASHGLMYAFASIYWKAIGLSDVEIGILWSAAVVAEVAIFAVFTRLFSRMPATTILTVAGVAAVARWLFYPAIVPLGLGVPGFVAAQALHAFSTGLVLIGVQKVIAESVPEDRTGAAQGVAFFANGIAMAAVTLASGPLYAWLGVDAFLVMVFVALAGLASLQVARRSAP